MVTSTLLSEEVQNKTAALSWLEEMGSHSGDNSSIPTVSYRGFRLQDKRAMFEALEFYGLSL